ncbi:hypothetical protein LUD75_17950 [Epilithonimonas sp. JDS]|uniref:hypothetical protein n=1 Tax=Epilithonimonas sp. JDS TaxID=2902797 RepID=UPI001E35F81B|nr:hypothetical protein [Epilithonimonas sp. JDS]MCD9856611.1 hypothetical protein [Epilithonimonas sp. JDS]
MKTIFTFFLIYIFQFSNCQRLNDDIKFEKLNADDSIRINDIEKVLSKSKIINQAECNEYLKYGCIKDYIIIYIYKNEPIFIDKKSFDIIQEMRSDGTEKTLNFITKTRIYITDWNNQKFIGKQMIKSQEDIRINNIQILDRKEIEDIINSNNK